MKQQKVGERVWERGGKSLNEDGGGKGGSYLN